MHTAKSGKRLRSLIAAGNRCAFRKARKAADFQNAFGVSPAALHIQRRGFNRRQNGFSMSDQPHALSSQADPPTEAFQQAAPSPHAPVIANCCDTAEDVRPKASPTRDHGAAMAKFSKKARR